MVRSLSEPHPCHTFFWSDIGKKAVIRIGLNCHKSHLHVVTFQPFPHSIPWLKKKWKRPKLSKIWSILNLCLKDVSTFFFALTTILQPTRALKFKVHFFLRGRLKRLKTVKLQDWTFQDHFFNMCPRSLQLSSSYTINHDDELESLFLSGNLELFF